MAKTEKKKKNICMFKLAVAVRNRKRNCEGAQRLSFLPAVCLFLTLNPQGLNRKGGGKTNGGVGGK